MGVDRRYIARPMRDRLYLDTTIAGKTTMMNLTGGVVLICVAVVMIWFASVLFIEPFAEAAA